jgi:hypothetical protein
MAAGLDDMRDAFLGGMKDWEPPRQQGGYPEEYAAFGCTASECGPVGAMAAEIRAAGVDQVGGARLRRRQRRTRYRKRQRGGARRQTRKSKSRYLLNARIHIRDPRY